MTTFLDKVKKKISEYGIPFPEPSECGKNEYLIMGPKFIIYINDAKERVCVSFKSSLEPDKAAQLTLILSEINGVNNVAVMEVFEYGDGNNLISGDEAIQYSTSVMENKVVKEFVKKQTALLALQNMKCHEC